MLGLELGADDYVTKPFSPRELVARVQGRACAARRRTRRPTADVRTVGARHPRPRPPAASPSTSDEVALTATEFALLAHLMAGPGRVFPREQLLAEVWGYAAAVGTRTVDVHVAQVRGKLGDASPDPHGARRRATPPRRAPRPRTRHERRRRRPARAATRARHQGRPASRVAGVAYRADDRRRRRPRRADRGARLVPADPGRGRGAGAADSRPAGRPRGRPRWPVDHRPARHDARLRRLRSGAARRRSRPCWPPVSGWSCRRRSPRPTADALGGGQGASARSAPCRARATSSRHGPCPVAGRRAEPAGVGGAGTGLGVPAATPGRARRRPGAGCRRRAARLPPRHAVRCGAPPTQPNGSPPATATFGCLPRGPPRWPSWQRRSTGSPARWR